MILLGHLPNAGRKRLKVSTPKGFAPAREAPPKVTRRHYKKAATVENGSGFLSEKMQWGRNQGLAPMTPR